MRVSNNGYSSRGICASPSLSAGLSVGLGIGFKLLLILSTTLLLPACSRYVFSSDSLTRPIDKDASAVGLSYALPKAVIRGKLVVDPSNAAFVLCLLSKPVATADAGQQYYMPFNNNKFSADQYTILKDETTGRLTSINVTTIDRTNEFAVNLAKSAAAVSRALRKQEGAQLSSSMCSPSQADLVVLATFDIDPANHADNTSTMGAVNHVMLHFARMKSNNCRRIGTPARGKAKGDTYDDQNACDEYRRIAKTYSRHNPPIRMQWQLPPAAPHAPKPDCSVGFCYRHTLPHTVQLVMAGNSVHSYTYQLPNASPIIAMDITRAITVTKTTAIDFGELGQITKIVVQKGNKDGANGSEAEGVALLPFNVVNAYFGALSSTAEIIGKSFTSEATLINNKTARDKAEYDSIDQRLKLDKRKAGQEGGGLKEEDYAIVASNGLNVLSHRLVAEVTQQPPTDAGDPDAPVVAAPVSPATAPKLGGGKPAQ